MVALSALFTSHEFPALVGLWQTLQGREADGVIRRRHVFPVLPFLGQWNDASRIDRRFLSPQSWIAVLRMLSDTLEPGPLPADGPISTALLPEGRRRSLVLQYLYAVPVGDGPDVVRQLDDLLGGSATPVLRLE